MGKNNVILTTVLVLFIVAHVSNAEFLLNFRKLADSSPKEDPNVTVPPIPSPVGGIDKGTDKSDQTNPPSTPGENKPKEEQAKDITPPATPSPPGESNPKEEQVKNISPPAKPPTDSKQHDDTPKEEVKGDSIDSKKENVKGDSKDPKEEVKQKGKREEKPSESCDGMERRCKDEKSMVACIKSFDDVSKVFVLLVQNKGVNNLKVDFTSSSSGNKQDVMDLSKLQAKQVNIPLANVGGNEIKLNAGNGYCVLHLDVGTPVFQGNYLRWDPSYNKFVTPIYGAYLMLAITLVAGGVCACCWFSRRKKTSEVPYQELEMSRPESAGIVDSAEGWDEVWDDDWDEEQAVKSPGHSISANGLTSRTPKKDGWEEWDD